MAARGTFTGDAKIQEQRVLQTPLLLDHSEDVGFREDDNQIPLHTAIGNEDTEVVPTLSGRTREDNEVINPFYYASMPSHSAAIEMQKEASLDQGASTDVPDIYGMTPLHYAVRRGNSREVVELLVNASADVNCRDNTGATPLFFTGRNSRDVVELLLNVGADVNCKDIYGMTPLLCAVEINSSREVVELLVNAGADVNCRDNNGMTPLMYARSTHAMKLLLQKGAEVNAQDCEGRTPLHCMAGLTDITLDDLVSELLDWGASLTAKDNSGNMPIENWCFAYHKHVVKWACAYHHSEVGLDLLQQLISDSNSSFHLQLKNLRDSCREEVERMKQKKFGYHSLYDVFRQYQDPRYLNNIELEKGIKMNSLNEEFPIYDSLLKSTYTIAKERVDLCEVIVNNFETPLPREVMMYILTFLDHDSLVHMITATKETKD